MNVAKVLAEYRRTDEAREAHEAGQCTLEAALLGGIDQPRVMMVWRDGVAIPHSAHHRHADPENRSGGRERP